MSNESKVIAEMQNGNCAVLLMCHSLPDSVREKLSKEFRKRCPRGRIIGITNVPWPQARSELDLYVFGVEGPEALISAIRTGRTNDRSDAA